MKNNSNLIIAVIIVVGFIFFWDSLVVKKFTPKPTTEQKAAAAATASSATMASTLSAPGKALASTKSISLQTIAFSSKTLTTETADVTVESAGGRVSSWKVKEHSHWIELVTTRKLAKAHPLETYPDLNFAVESSAADKIILVADHPSGFRIRKTISLASTPPLNVISLEFKNISKAPLTVDTKIGWGEGLGKHIVDQDPKMRQVEAHMPEMKAIAYADKFFHWKSGFIFGRTVDQTITGPYEWVGVDNNHFLVAFVSPGGKIASASIFADRDTAPILELPITLTLAPGETKTAIYDLYVGPKMLSNLKLAGHDLDQSITFGFFGVISKGLLRALEFFKKITGNYGWAIVILTICLQIAVFPLTRKSLAHSVKMKELQPQLKQLQAQFKADPKRLQIETLNLYKKNGMNFMGLEGCAPILLQIPVFFAFYAALNGAYELRGAPWIFWIHDLAAPDPMYVLPVIMGIGMFFQQKLTAVATDPAQAKMMMMMPIIFVFMFFKMPAGLVLYWSINSVCTIAGQRLLQWQKESQKPLSP